MPSVFHGRSKIASSLSFSLSDAGWADKLRGLTYWTKVGSVIAAADRQGFFASPPGEGSNVSQRLIVCNFNSSKAIFENLN